VSDAAPSVSAVVQSAAAVQPVSTPTQSFAAALAGANVTDDKPLPSPCIKGDSLVSKYVRTSTIRELKSARMR